MAWAPWAYVMALLTIRPPSPACEQYDEQGNPIMTDVHVVLYTDGEEGEEQFTRNSNEYIVIGVSVGACFGCLIGHGIVV